MRVLLVSSSMIMRGGERQTLELGTRLAGRGLEVAWALRGGSALSRAVPPGAPSVEAPFELLPVWTPLVLRRFIARWSPDLVHAQTSRAHSHALIACRGGPPLVVSRRVAFAGSRPLAPLKYGAGVAHFIPISQAAARSLAGRGVEGARMTVVPSGVDTVRFSSARRDGGVRSSLGGDAGTVLVGTVAAFEREKGLGVLLEAAGLLSEGAPQIRFVVAGEGRLERRLRSEIQRRGLDGAVRLTRPPPDLAAMLAAIDIFVLPSIEEGLSTALIAAAAAGLPCVASDTGGIPEVIGGGAGTLVPPGDAVALAEAIARLGADPLLRGELGSRGKERAAEFDIERMVDRTISVYRSVTGGG